MAQVVRERRSARLRGGSVSTIAALSSFAMLGFVAMAVDWGSVYMAKTKLQIATDAAAVAAVSALPDGVAARSLAKAYAAQITIRGTPVTLADGDIELGVWDGAAFTPTADIDADVVRVTSHVDYALPLTKLFGVGSVPLRAVAGGGGVVGGPSPDLVIVQDVTSSFSAEIYEARTADLALVSCVDAKASGETKVGLVSFTGYETNLLAPNELVTYTSSYNNVTAKIQALKVCGNAGQPPCSGTNIAAGLYLAKGLLDGSTSDEEVGRAAVLVSDGAPNASSTCVTPGGNYLSAFSAAYCPYWGNAPTNAKLDAAAYDLRDAFEADGYDLYTVFYNESSNNAESAFMQNMVAGDGIYLESPDPNDLGDMLAAVCRSYVRTNPGLVF